MHRRRGVKGGALTWDVRGLEVAADRECGIVADQPAPIIEPGDEPSIWETRTNATTKGKRPQHRHEKAA